MNKEQAVLNDIRERLSDFRYIHSLEVAKSARELAVKYGYDPNKAYLAGLSHDVLKELTKEEFSDFFRKENISLSPVEKNAPKLWHSIAGAKYLEKNYGLCDEIISAVRYHTTGKENMTPGEKILFVADFISLDRSYNGVEDMRRRALISLEYAMEEGLRFTIEELAAKNLPIHPDTLACYNEILLREKQTKKEE